LKCPYAKCSKLYGSEGSLNLHIKIKHNGGNKTDREKIAKSIVIAKANGVEITDDIKLKLNLPPGSIEKAAHMLSVKIEEPVLSKLEDNVQKLNEEKENEIKQDLMMKKEKFTNKKATASATKANQSNQSVAKNISKDKSATPLMLSENKEADRVKYMAPKKTMRQRSSTTRKIQILSPEDAEESKRIEEE